MRQDSLALQKRRVWEIDALRGILILGVLLFHLFFTLDAFFVDGRFKNIDTEAFLKIADPLGALWRKDSKGTVSWVFLGKYFDFVNHGGVVLLFLISGISCNFSRNKLKSALRLLGGAAFVSVFTKLLAVHTEDETRFIRFGALHCYAACQLLHYFLLEGRKDRALLAVAAVALPVGYYLRVNPVYLDSPLLIPFGIWERGAYMQDYWPVLPMLGWFLIGAVLGRHLYSEKNSRFPKQAEQKWHRPLCFLGRYSGLIYCGHMVVYTLLFCGIGYIFKLY